MSCDSCADNLYQQQQQQQHSAPGQEQKSCAPACSGDRCFERQRELVDCLTYETVAGHRLSEQLALDARSLAGQLVAAADARERSMAALFDVAGRLDAAFGVYRDAVAAADAASAALSDQHDVVRDGRLCVDHFRCRLARVRTDTAESINIGGSGNSAVYANGCAQQQQQCSADNCTRPTTSGSCANTKQP